MNSCITWLNEPIKNLPKKWDKRFMNLAHEIANWSEDKATQVGCLIVNKDQQILTTGFNGFPRGIRNTDDRMIRPVKYQWVEHAERNAIFQAASLGISIKGSTLYSTLFPCTDCARAIIQSGIKEVITYYYKDTNRYSSWDDWQVSLEMLEEAWVGIHLLVKEGV